MSNLLDFIFFAERVYANMSTDTIMCLRFVSLLFIIVLIFSFFYSEKLAPIVNQKNNKPKNSTTAIEVLLAILIAILFFVNLAVNFSFIVIGGVLTGMFLLLKEVYKELYNVIKTPSKRFKNNLESQSILRKYER